MRKITSKYFILFLLMLFICLILPTIILQLPALAEDNPPVSEEKTTEVQKEPAVVAPALQYLREDYPAAFLSKDDFSIKLNTSRRYKLRCTKEISAIAIGDHENVLASENDEPDEEKMLYELKAPRDIIVKTKYETYTYMQIFTDEEKPVTLLLSVNSKNEVPSLITFGSCTMFEEID